MVKRDGVPMPGADAPSPKTAPREADLVRVRHEMMSLLERLWEVSDRLRSKADALYGEQPPVIGKAAPDLDGNAGFLAAIFSSSGDLDIALLSVEGQLDRLGGMI